MSEMPTHRCQSDPSSETLLRLLRSDDMDAAIEAGLMRFRACAACEREDTTYALRCAPILEAQQRLSRAWAARDRYRARQARLAQRAAERDARRASPGPVEQAKSALPPSAAAILARAKAKAAERR
jgi:Na+-translocating ferredoxin:NAD+ oxidoreductase RnfC subunit